MGNPIIQVVEKSGPTGDDESRLKESQEWFFTTLQSIGDAVVASDEKGRITYLNPRAELLTGWNQSEACGMSVGDILQIEKGEAPSAEESSPLLGAKGYGRREEEVVSRDGDRTPVEAKSALIRDRSGKV